MRIALCATALLVLAACGEEGAQPDAKVDPAAAWSTTVAFEAGVKLGGCAVGDFDPTKGGNEIAAVASDGRIFRIHRTAGDWEGEEVAKVSGEMIQCAVGDADPRRAGDELVVVGMKEGTEDSRGEGAAHLVAHRDGAWQVEPIGTDSALVHGVCIVDLAPGHAGSEVLTVGFGGQARLHGRTAEGWRVLAAVALPAPGKAAAALPDGAAVANMSDAVLALRLEAAAGGGLVATPVEAGAPQARIAASDGATLVACDDGTLRLLDGATVAVLHRESAKLRGAVLADLDPSVAGLEAATAGYEKTLTLLYPPAGEGAAWTPVTLWRDTERFHHLAHGELVAEGEGPELVACGYSGRVIVAARTRP